MASLGANLPEPVLATFASSSITRVFLFNDPRNLREHFGVFWEADSALSSGREPPACHRRREEAQAQLAYSAA
jgi:hypothetical protein